MNIKDWRQYDVDLLGTALLVLIALVGYALAIHAPLMDSLRYDEARQQRHDVSVQIAALQTRCAAAKRQTEEKEAADRAALNAWTEANDAALTVLSWLASEAPIPSKVQDGYPDRATFQARIQKIAAILKERKA